MRSAVLIFLAAINADTAVATPHVYPPLDPAEHYRVYIDPDFDDVDEQSIHVAVNEWNRALHGAAVIDVAESGYTQADADAGRRRRGIVITRVSSTTCRFFPQSPAGTLAWIDSVGGDKVWIARDRITPADVEEIAMHELAHVLGAADHYGTKGSLMDAHFVGQPACVDALTANEVETYLSLPAHAIEVTCR